MDIKGFLQKQEIQNLLTEENLEEIYRKIYFSDRRYLTEFFIINNINPLGYMTIVFSYMYERTDIKTITIPKNITRINSSAFEECKSLTSITIPDTVRYIGEDAFYGCDKLKIKCKRDSCAHLYAFRNQLQFELI